MREAQLVDEMMAELTPDGGDMMFERPSFTGDTRSAPGGGTKIAAPAPGSVTKTRSRQSLPRSDTLRGT